ncbi:MAG: ROK family protein [Ignavibacteriaceae bacterium]
MGILGIDLGGTNVRAGLVENNSLIKVESFPVSKNGSESDVLNDIYNLIDHYSSEEISGIGIGVPSVVDVEKGIVYDVQNISSWKEVYLKELLKKRYNVPVYVNNDANCFAIGEKYFGKAKNYKDIVGLIIGTGLGAGIITNGKLYTGKNCGAGEFGMIPFKRNNYEYYCSGQYFVNEFRTTGEELFRRAEKGDPEALDVFSGFGANLGEAIKVIMYTIDPEIIVLGGSVSKSYNLFKDEMFRSINNFAYSKTINKLKIEVSVIDNVAILGAAALYYDDNNINR